MNELTPVTQERLTPMQIKADHNLILQVMEAVMEKGMDYGLVPGCGNKPTLLKPGSEKLMMTFRLASKPAIEDMSGPDEIRYRVVTEIIHGPTGIVYGYGVGEASSSEEKYKWRKAVCQEEWDETPEDRRRKKWGKGQTGTYFTPQVRTNPSDIANTVLKMADKRSVISGILKATAASSIFTQDLEDLSEDMRQAVVEAPEGSMPKAVAMPKPMAPKPATTAAPQASPDPETTAKPSGEFRMMVSKFGGQCHSCGGQIEKGTDIAYDPNRKIAFHKSCAEVGQ